MEKEIDILLVEDNEHEARLAIMGLESRNLADRVFHVEDGEEALEFIFANGRYDTRHGQRNPKLILLDLKLPKVNGLEVLREIKTNARTKSIPIVLLTSSQEDRDVVMGYELGVNSYIVKSINFSAFCKDIVDVALYWTVLNLLPAQQETLSL
jgi:two-component system response regulator